MSEMTDNEVMGACQAIDRELNVLVQARRAMQQIPQVVARYQEAQKFLAGADSQMRATRVQIEELEQRRLEAERKTKPAQERLEALEREYAARKATLDREIAAREKRIAELKAELESFKSKIAV